jgi:small subunit ribosomal protein S20
MATHKSAEKRIRRNTRRREFNRSNLTRMRSAVKALRAALAARDLDKAGPMLRATTALIDRLARKGVLHPNAAARTKSRLSRGLRRLEAGAPAR